MPTNSGGDRRWHARRGHRRGVFLALRRHAGKCDLHRLPDLADCSPGKDRHVVAILARDGQSLAGQPVDHRLVIRRQRFVFGRHFLGEMCSPLATLACNSSEVPHFQGHFKGHACGRLIRLQSSPRNKRLPSIDRADGRRRLTGLMLGPRTTCAGPEP